ncbi:MAG: hypothetical protein GY822_27140 [Deltaproteobacteria bacterium]|nr:hypothetical protein [Deltaproteobacteria bacterium]
MGFFSKLKNAVTGGGANVRVEVSEVTVGESFEVKVMAQAEADLKFKRVYLYIQSFESAMVHEIPVAEDHGIVVQTVEGEFQTQNMDVEVAGAGEISAGEEVEWVVEVSLPDDAMPSFQGETVGHHWRIMVGLDAFGNDPDSGWIEMEVSV